jgi:hypothetical protein
MLQNDYAMFGCRQEMIDNYLSTHECTYTAVVEYSIGWYESCKTAEEAVQLLRELVEADGHHVFMKQTPFIGGYTHSDRNKISSRLYWCDTLTGKTLTKQIKVNVLLKEIPEVVKYWEEREAWRQKQLRELYPWRYSKED